LLHSGMTQAGPVAMLRGIEAGADQALDLTVK
jgi:hypothetical protein